MSATYTPLANTTLASAVTNITFGSIPGTYRDLILVIQANMSSQTTAKIRFNADSGSNYSYVTLMNDVTTGISSAELRSVDALTTTGYMAVANIMDYSTTDKEKMILTRADNASATANDTNLIINRWASTAAITSVQITSTSTPTFSIGTTFSLYGIIA